MPLIIVIFSCVFLSLSSPAKAADWGKLFNIKSEDTAGGALIEKKQKMAIPCEWRGGRMTCTKKLTVGDVTFMRSEDREYRPVRYTLVVSSNQPSVGHFIVGSNTENLGIVEACQRTAFAALNTPGKAVQLRVEYSDNAWKTINPSNYETLFRADRLQVHVMPTSDYGLATQPTNIYCDLVDAE